jgi:hypothetical protein
MGDGGGLCRGQPTAEHATLVPAHRKSRGFSCPGTVRWGSGEVLVAGGGGGMVKMVFVCVCVCVCVCVKCPAAEREAEEQRATTGAAGTGGDPGGQRSHSSADAERDLGSTAAEQSGSQRSSAFGFDHATGRQSARWQCHRLKPGVCTDDGRGTAHCPVASCSRRGDDGAGGGSPCGCAPGMARCGRGVVDAQVPMPLVLVLGCLRSRRTRAERTAVCNEGMADMHVQVRREARCGVGAVQ